MIDLIPSNAIIGILNKMKKNYVKKSNLHFKKKITKALSKAKQKSFRVQINDDFHLSNICKSLYTNIEI